MNRAASGKIAIVWREDRTTPCEVTPRNNRFHRIFEELAALNIEAEPAVYDETFADEVRAQLLQANGVLVWVNPLQDGKTRHATPWMPCCASRSQGPWVSAHPDTILKMGTKEVLVRTRHLGWGPIPSSMRPWRSSAMPLPHGWRPVRRASSSKVAETMARASGKSSPRHRAVCLWFTSLRRRRKGRLPAAKLVAAHFSLS